MLLVVNLAAGAVLFAVDLLPFLSSEGAAVCGAIVVDLFVDVGLTLVGAAGFGSGHLTGLSALSDTRLLVAGAIVDEGLLAGGAVGGGDGRGPGVLLCDLVIGGGGSGGDRCGATMVDGWRAGCDPARQPGSAAAAWTWAGCDARWRTDALRGWERG